MPLLIGRILYISGQEPLTWAHLGSTWRPFPLGVPLETHVGPNRDQLGNLTRKSHLKFPLGANLSPTKPTKKPT